MGTEGRTRSIWPYLEELLLQVCVNGKEGSGALLQSSVTVKACILVWKLFLKVDTMHSTYLFS